MPLRESPSLQSRPLRALLEAARGDPPTAEQLARLAARLRPLLVPREKPRAAFAALRRLLKNLFE